MDVCRFLSPSWGSDRHKTKKVSGRLVTPSCRASQSLITIFGVGFPSSPVPSGEEEHGYRDEDGQEDVGGDDAHDGAHVHHVAGAALWWAGWKTKTMKPNVRPATQAPVRPQCFYFTLLALGGS